MVSETSKQHVQPYVSYQPMLPFHAAEAERVVCHSLRLTADDLSHMGDETPSQCFEAYFNRKTPQGREHNEAWARSSLNQPDSLQYFVAMAGGHVVGVSGIYQALPGYTEQLGAHPPQPQLENDRTFWLGWFGVAGAFQGKGVGTALLRHSVTEAVKRAGLQVRECQYAIYADAGAIAYYEKLGLVKQAEIEGGHGIMRVPLAALATTLNIDFAGKTAAEKQTSFTSYSAASFHR